MAACVTAASCSSTANTGATGGQGSGGSEGIGGSGAGGSGQGGGAAIGGNSGTGDGGANDGGQSGTGGQGGNDCSPACTTSSVCLGSGTQGGAVLFADGGVCPTGRHIENNLCLQDLTFACKPIPTGCNGTATCACASSLCSGSGQICGVPGPGELTCILEAP